MNATPATMVRQHERAVRVNRPSVRPVFTSETGKSNYFAPERVETWEDFCFICSRCTDHTGEEHTDREGNVIPQRDEVDTRETLSKDGSILYVEHSAYVYRA